MDEDDVDFPQEEEVDDDEVEASDTQLPAGTFKLRPSGFRLPPTVYVDYPVDLNVLRTDIGYLEDLGNRVLHYKCAWERNCIKNGFHRAGFENSDGTVLCAPVNLNFIVYFCLLPT